MPARPNIQPLGAPRMRLEYLLYLEAFAYCCLLVALKQTVLIPWAVQYRMTDRIGRLQPYNAMHIVELSKLINDTNHLVDSISHQWTANIVNASRMPWIYNTDRLPCDLKSPEKQFQQLACENSKTYQKVCHRFQYKTLKHRVFDSKLMLTKDYASLFRLECCRPQRKLNKDCHCDYQLFLPTSHKCHAIVHNYDGGINTLIEDLSDADVQCVHGRVGSYDGESWRNALKLILKEQKKVLVGIKWKCHSDEEWPRLFALDSQGLYTISVTARNLLGGHIITEDISRCRDLDDRVGSVLIDGRNRKLVVRDEEYSTQEYRNILCESDTVPPVWWRPLF